MKNIELNGEVFAELRAKLNAAITKVMLEMESRETREGKVTASIGIELVPVDAGGRTALSPNFNFKVGYQMSIKDDESFSDAYTNEEVMRTSNGFVIVPITGADQQSIYDYIDPETGENKGYGEA